MTIEWIITIVLVLGVTGFIASDYLLLRRGFDLAGRIKQLMLGLIFSGIGFIFIFVDYAETKDLLELSSHGIEAVGQITASKEKTTRRRRRLKVTFPSTVAFDGRTHEFNLDRVYPAGTELFVVYSGRNPKVVRLSTLKNGFFDYLLSEHSLWAVVLSILAPIALILLGKHYIRTALAPKEVFDAATADG